MNISVLASQLCNSKKPSINKIGEGFCNEIFEIDNRYLLKVVKPDLPKDHYELNTLTVEASIIKNLQELQSSLPLPKVLAISEEHEAYVYQKVEGVTLEEYVKGKDPMRYVDFLVDTITNIANLSEALATTIPLHLDTSTDWKWYDNRYNEMKAYISTDEEKNCRQVFEAFIASKKVERTPYAIHNDLHGGNIIVDPSSGDVRGIIDFGDFCMADMHKEIWNTAKIAPELALAVGDALISRGFPLDPVFIKQCATTSALFEHRSKQSFQAKFAHLRSLGLV